MPETRSGLDSSKWREVDTTGDAEFFVGYLDRVAVGLRAVRQEMIRALEIFPGASVLDVGSGTGEFLFDVASVIPNVRAVGIDPSTALNDVGRARAATAGLQVEFVSGDAEHLDFPDSSFHRINCARVLLHLDHPDAAVTEMARVLAPNGRIAIWEPDFDAFMMDSEDLAIATAVRSHLTAALRNPDIGRRLRRLVLEAGLELVELSGTARPVPSLQYADSQFHFFAALEAAVASGEVSSKAAARWRAWLERADACNQLFLSPVGFHALATKSSS
jgi:SAM-dependent methyltransferase